MSDPLAETTVASPVSANEARYWHEQIAAAEKREDTWRKHAGEAVELYEGQKVGENTFNILYSNTETLLPAVYNQLPRPSIRRRFEDDDPLGKAVAEVVKRGLEYTLDTPDAQYTPCDDLFEAAVLGALVPGRGITRFRYDPEFAQSEETRQSGLKAGAEPAGGDPDEDEGDLTDSAQTAAKPPPRKVTYEAVCGINWPHDRFAFGFARRWRDVPWIAYEHRMTRADLKANFGRGWADRIPLTGPEGERARDAEGQKGAPKAAVVYEVWHRSAKTVLFVARDYADGIVKRVPDPLRISGFYDCPCPLQFLKRNTNLNPVTLYRLYEQQAKELNRISQRINKVVAAIKVRGFYNGQLKELSDLLSKDDNTLVPAEAAVALIDSGGLDRHIWLVPIEKLITVLQQLYVQREAVKTVIYEITGISDIIRGASVASETATAQTIKNQWGTLRLKRLQKSVQKYIRDCLRIQAGIMGQHFAPETWAKITGLTFTQPEEKQQAQMEMEQVRSQMLSASQSGQPPQIPPEAGAKLAQLQQTLQSIDWGQIVEVLGDDLSRGYRIDIETNSTIDADATEDRQNITDFMTALGQFMQAFGPMVEQGALPMGAVRAILLTITRRFSFGPDVEDELKKIPDQLPQKPDDNAAKAQADQQIAQTKLAVAEKEAQLKMQLMEKQLEVDQAELQMKAEELALKREELQQKQALNGVQHQGRMQAAAAKAAMAQATGAMAGGGQPSAGGGAQPAPGPSIDGDVVTVGGKRKRVVRDASGAPVGLETLQ